MRKSENNQTFLALIRLGIGHDVKALPESIDWEAMRAVANEQSLTAILLDGVLALSRQGALTGGRSLDIAYKMQWINSVALNYERRYEDYRKQIGELAGFYNAHGLKLMILKGYGLSLNYPQPKHRPCGDIDTWAFGRYKEVDKLLSEKLSIPVDSTLHHHTVYQFGDFTIENHYDFVNVHYGHRNAELEQIFKELATDDSFWTEIDGQRVYLPSPNLHALFLLRHTMFHFSSTQMTIRQLLDWGFFIEKNATAIDWDWFESVLTEFHMKDFFACVNAICVEDLGFDATLFPPTSVDADLKKRVLDDTFSPEFYESPPPHNKLLKRVFFKYRRWKSNGWKHDFCYGGNRLKAFFISAWSHILKPASI